MQWTPTVKGMLEPTSAKTVVVKHSGGSTEVRMVADYGTPYEVTFLWWTLDSHEPRTTEEHIEDVMEEFKSKVDECLEKMEELDV